MNYTISCSEPVATPVIDSVVYPDLASCSSGWITSAYVPPFDPSQIDPVVVAAMFGGGFLLYFTPWAVAWGFTQMLKLLR